MHAHERWLQTLNALDPDKVTSVEELSGRLAVSPATVRRDLLHLEREGKLRRVRGGALPIVDSGADAPKRLRGQESYEVSKIRNVEAKRAIGARAAAMCEPGEAIIIDGGTTTQMMAESLGDERYQIMTTSLNIATKLFTRPNIRVMLPGGELYRDQNIVLSPYEDGILKNFHATKLFLGAQAITAGGPMQTDPLLVHAEKRLMEQAARLVVLVDSSKFATRAPLAVCPLAAIDVLITDTDIPQAAEAQLHGAGVEVIKVPLAAPSHAA